MSCRENEGVTWVVVKSQSYAFFCRNSSATKCDQGDTYSQWGSEPKKIAIVVAAISVAALHCIISYCFIRRKGRNPHLN